MKYKLLHMAYGWKLVKFHPEHIDDDGKLIAARWQREGYYFMMEHAIRELLQKELILVGDELQEQLENLSSSIDNAVKEIMGSIEIKGK